MLDRSVPRSPEFVSVVIPALNARCTIDLQLSALADQDYSGPFEVVISDNGSTDGLREHLASHPLRQRLRLRVIDGSRKAGVAHARNAGVRASRGDFVVMCDSDDRVDRRWITAMAAMSPDFDVLGGVLDTRTLSSAATSEWWPHHDTPELIGPPGFLVSAPGGNLGFWRTAFDAVGGFDDSYAVASEDVDFSWRLQLAGFTMGCCPDAVVAYRLRDTPAGIWRQARAHGEGQARLYARYRHHGHPRPPILATAFLVAGVLVRNPLLPRAVTRASAGEWAYYAGILTGRVIGSMRERMFYV